MQRIDFIAMGCDTSIFLDSDAPEAITALQQTQAWFEEWEQVLSRFRPTSELAALNRFAGYWFNTSETLWDVLQAALDSAARTAGRVTPTVLPQLLAAGYDRPFEAFKTEGAGQNTAAPNAVPAADWRAIELNTGQRAVRLPRGTALDFGGIAKGWAAEKTAQRLVHLGGVLVDAGGDMAARGRRIDDGAWPIGISDPRTGDADENALLDIILIHDCGVATSGRDYRRWQHHGRAQHHIIDPHTGQPADTDVLSATVIAADAAAAETAAKQVLLLGSDAGLCWIDAQPGAAALLVTNDGAIRTSAAFDRYTERIEAPAIDAA